jgi:putative ABC transport system substrate-binding protein
MRRREFFALIGAGAMLPLVARAQQSKKVYRIAILSPSRPVSELTENSPVKYWREFFHELRELGDIEGNNLVVERFSGEGDIDHYPELAREAAASNPNVIFAIATYMLALSRRQPQRSRLSR